VTATTLPPTGLRFDNIDKRYGGLYALRRVSLEIAPGECVALAGRNGSGKTTLLRIAAQIVLPTAGKLTFPGAVPNTPNGRPGYVAHATMVYDELSAEENLVLFAKLQNVDNPAARAEDLLREVGLFERRDSLVRTFSRGMRQRIAIARALIHRPSVLLMSLHGESEISALATRAVHIDAGKIIADTNTGGASLHSVLTFGAA
jgi:heme exporter protein A